MIMSSLKYVMNRTFKASWQYHQKHQFNFRTILNYLKNSIENVKEGQLGSTDDKYDIFENKFKVWQYLYIYASTVLTQSRSQTVNAENQSGCSNLFKYKTQNIDIINLVMTSS